MIIWVTYFTCVLEMTSFTSFDTCTECYCSAVDSLCIVPVIRLGTLGRVGQHGHWKLLS